MRAMCSRCWTRSAPLERRCWSTRPRPWRITLATMAPERVDRLVLINAYARITTTDDYPHGHAPELIRAFLDTNIDPDTEWSQDGADDRALIAPSLKDDPAFGAWWMRSTRRGASPANALAHPRAGDANPMSVRCSRRLPVPTLVIHRRDNLSARSAVAATSVRTSPTRSTSSCRARISFRGRATRTRSSTRSRSSSPGSGVAPANVCSRPCCSPTSSTPRSRRPRSGTERGGHGSRITTRSCARSCAVTVAGRSIRPATASWRRSTAQRRRSRCARAIVAASACGRDPAAGRHPHRRVSSAGATISPGWRCTSRPGSRPWPARAKCSFRGPCATSSVVRSCASSDRGDHELKGVPERWQLFALVD